MSTLTVPVTPHDHAVGPTTAPVTLLEYGDYECSYCGMAHPVVKQLQQYFGARMRFVFRHFPLSQAHPHAESAAQTAEFAGANGKFWAMHDGLYENQDRLSLPLYFALVDALGLSELKLREALAEGTYAPEVRTDFLSGVRSGVNGTPCFFINGTRHDGSYAFPDLQSAIDLTLRAHASI